MGIMNINNFYFKKGANDAYSASGAYARLTDYVGMSGIADTTLYPLCNFFKEYNDANTIKIREHIDVPSQIKTFDPSFVTIPLWDNKTFRGGANCRPARKYDMDILHSLYIYDGMQTYTSYDIFYQAAGAGVIVLSGGGGGGGGGDAGGFFNEPSGGGGGGSGGWAVVYFRYKNNRYRDPSECFCVSFGTADSATSGNFYANGGARNRFGAKGAFVYITYKGTAVVSCSGGGGGGSDNSSDRVPGGLAGSTRCTPHSSGSGETVIDDDDLYMFVIATGTGASGGASGEGGTNSQALQVAAKNISVPSTVPNATLSLGNKGGGWGGKLDVSDPGGGGGGGSICAAGGNGSNGNGGAGDGGDGAGGGGASERNAGSGKGGRAVAIMYMTM